MESRRTLFLAVLAIITCLLLTGEALQCNQCTSIEDSLCQDPFKDYFHSNSSSKFLRKCANPAAQFCRKVSQYVRGVETVIRDCGVKAEKKNNYCYRTVSQEFTTKTCQCWADGCNGGDWRKISSAIMAICSIGSLLLF